MDLPHRERRGIPRRLVHEEDGVLVVERGLDVGRVRVERVAFAAHERLVLVLAVPHHNLDHRVSVEPLGGEEGPQTHRRTGCDPDAQPLQGQQPIPKRRGCAHPALLEHRAAYDQIDGIVLQQVRDELDREPVRDELQVDRRRQHRDRRLARDHLRDRLRRKLGHHELRRDAFVREVPCSLRHPEREVLEVVAVRDEDADGRRGAGFHLWHRCYSLGDFHAEMGEHRASPLPGGLVRSTVLLLVLPLALLALPLGGCDSCNDKSSSGTAPTTSASAVASTPASASAPPAASSATLAPSGKMAHCPNAVTGATSESRTSPAVWRSP